MRFPRTNLALSLALLLTADGSLAAEGPAEPPQTTAAKPAIKLAEDGFPTGAETPEGAACDLARAFIARDAKLFRAVCLPVFGGGEDRTAYEKFLAETAASIEEEAKIPTPSPGGPKALGKVFAARHLSKEGPASYGYAAFGFEDVMFVDVGCTLQNGGRFLNRTLVVKTKGGAWRVHPAPSGTSLLATGLNEEPASTEDFSGRYAVPKP